MEGSAKYAQLRILMITDTIGGVWSYSVELCNALQPFDVHFYLVTTGGPIQPAQKKEIEKVENVTVYESDYLLEWMESPWQNIDASGASLLQLEEELQPDLIHLNSYAYGSLPWDAPVIMVAHSDVWSWWLSVKGEFPPTEWSEYFKRVTDGLQSADYLIAPSKWMMNCIRKIYSATTPGEVIYNGRSAETFYPASKENYVFSMGRIWDEAKNIQLLVEAASHIGYPIKLAGDNSFEGNSIHTAGSNINYLGKLSVQQVASQLSTAAVYVLPARYEPFGLSVLEAALCGCALVLGKTGSLEEIWNDSAIYVDPHDATALADAVNYLMSNETVLAAYAERAMKQAMNYTTTTMAESYLSVYYQMLQQEKQILSRQII